MIDPSQRFREAGASDELAAVLAKAEQELIERFGSSYEELRTPLLRCLCNLASIEAIVSAEARGKPVDLDTFQSGAVSLTRLAKIDARLEALEQASAAKQLAKKMADYGRRRAALLEFVGEWFDSCIERAETDSYGGAGELRIRLSNGPTDQKRVGILVIPTYPERLL